MYFTIQYLRNRQLISTNTVWTGNHYNLRPTNLQSIKIF